MKAKRTPPLDLETIMPMLIGIWRRFHKEPGPPDVLQTREFRRVVACVRALHERFEEGQSLIGQDIFKKPDLLGAYLLYQWVIHYQEGMSLLGEIPYVSRRVLDVCSGPGAYAFAALRHGAQEVFAVDRNLAALQLGAEVCGRYGMPLTIRTWDCLQEPLTVDGRFDLIIVAHCLDELFPLASNNSLEHQRYFLDNLLSRLNPKGFLLLVDNSFSEANRRLLTLRDQLVQSGVPVQAPCVWKGECVALKSNSFCYAQRDMEKPYLIKEIQRAAQINLSSLKMSYILFRYPQSGWPTLSDKSYYRIISPAVESYQGKRYYLCGTDGKKSLGSHLDRHPVESRAFEYLRRGELISIEEGLSKHNALDIVQGTRVTSEAACGKPIPEIIEVSYD